MADAESIETLLAGAPALAGRPELVEVAAHVFNYVQILLDDENNLTKTGNLTGAAKDLLRQFALEQIDAAHDFFSHSPRRAEEDTP